MKEYWFPWIVFQNLQGLESALQAEGSEIIYRAFVGEKQGKGVLVFLVVPETELKYVEQGFLNFIATIQLF